jgi:hypothetical protein
MSNRVRHRVRVARRVARCVAFVAGAAAMAPMRARAQLVTAAIPATPVLLPVGMWGGPSAAISAATSVLTLRINSGASQSISSLRDGQVNAFSSPVSVTTQWDMASAATIDLVAYFASPTAALRSGNDVIPSLYVSGRMATGNATAFTPFTQNAVAGVGTTGASLHLFRQSVTVAANGVGQRTDNLELQLDLRGRPAIPTGRFSGTLTLRAIAY